MELRVADMPEINAAIQQLAPGRLFWIDWKDQGSFSLRRKLVNSYETLAVRTVEYNYIDVRYFEPYRDDDPDWAADTKFIPISPEEQEQLEALLKLKPERLYIGPGGRKLEGEESA